MITRIRNYILAGLLVVLPLILSVAITVWLFKVTTSGLINIMPVYIKTHIVWRTVIRLLAPIALLAVLAIIGFFAKIVFIKKTFSIGEKILIKIPLFNKIYMSVKQISMAFLSQEKTMFNRVVLLEYPRKGIFSMGFITEISRGEIQKKMNSQEEVLNVFIPTTPNPTSGLIVFAPPHEVIKLDMKVEDGMKLVISGGSLIPPQSR